MSQIVKQMNETLEDIENYTILDEMGGACNIYGRFIYVILSFSSFSITDEKNLIQCLRNVEYERLKR